MQSESSIGRMLNRVRAELVEALDRELAPFKMTAAQFVILGSLVGGEADSASGLCKEISYDPGAMTRMIDRLEQKGLIRRLPHADDRRKVNLELTPEGKAVYPKLRASAVTVQNRFLRGFTQTEASQLEGFLQRMLASASPSRYKTGE
jgi:MarR family transcriptional regulator, multiple antibiotic resistance protein MarR